MHLHMYTYIRKHGSVFASTTSDSAPPPPKPLRCLAAAPMLLLSTSQGMASSTPGAS